MGTMRLVVDARDQGTPAEVSVDRLSELLADQKSQLWLDISDPGPAEVALQLPGDHPSPASRGAGGSRRGAEALGAEREPELFRCRLSGVHALREPR